VILRQVTAVKPARARPRQRSAAAQRFPASASAAAVAAAAVPPLGCWQHGGTLRTTEIRDAREMGGAVMKAISSRSSPSSTPAQLRSKNRAARPSVSPLPAANIRKSDL